MSSRGGKPALTAAAVRVPARKLAWAVLITSMELEVTVSKIMCDTMTEPLRKPRILMRSTLTLSSRAQLLVNCCTSKFSIMASKRTSTSVPTPRMPSLLGWKGLACGLLKGLGPGTGGGGALVVPVNVVEFVVPPSGVVVKGAVEVDELVPGL